MLQTQIDVMTMDVMDWWSTYGSETQQLVEVANKILSKPISSPSDKRNLSTYSYIHNVKRNRLNCSTLRADELVSIHSNIHLLPQFSESYKKSMEESSIFIAEMRGSSLDAKSAHIPKENEHHQQRKIAKTATTKGKGQKN